MPHYRQATGNDLAALCALGQEVNALHHAQFPALFAGPGAPDRDARHWGASLGQEDAVVFVAEEEAVIVGFISVSVATESHSLLKPVRFGKIGSVCVTPSWQGHGIGRQLMSLAQQWVAERGGDEVRLHVWKFNAKALRLYEELGYEIRSHTLAKAVRNAAHPF
jgi:ribosomal protein S18 acetylase RimI-like enzyme